VALTFDTLAEVALSRDLLRRWWGLELGLLAANGDGYDRTSHATCDTLMKVPNGLCAGSMREAAALAAKAKSAVVHRCHAGLTIVAAAVRGGDGKVAGIAYSSGGRFGVTVDEVAATISAETGVANEAPAMAAVPPQLDDTALARICDLVNAAAAACERAQPAIIPPTTWTHPFNEIVGDAPAVREVVKLLTKVVRSEATVLVHGESGTGKELIARAIHYHGPRGKKPFVVQNCSAFNDNLLESALFGHQRGAFTGAVKDQKGLFETADGGTFFLDEIGDMSAALQVKLLRVLQEGTFMPVGGTKPVRVDVRIVAASHKDLQTMVQHKQFREDLFYRVNVLKITVPPLRERVADIPRLVNHFLKKHTPTGVSVAGQHPRARERDRAHARARRRRDGAHRLDGVDARRRCRDRSAPAVARCRRYRRGRCDRACPRASRRRSRCSGGGARNFTGLPRCATRCTRIEVRVRFGDEGLPDLQESVEEGRQQGLPVLLRAVPVARSREVARRGVSNSREIERG
jgi:two-component system response regulator HupR/HoxA